MDRWEGRLAVVTGASSGIGRKVAEELVKSGMIVVGRSEILVRMMDHGEKVKLTTPVYYGGNYIPSRVRQAASTKKLIRSEFLIRCSSTRRCTN